MVAGHAHNPFHHKQTLFLRRKKHNNVVAADVAIGHQWAHPPRWWRELLPDHEYVVADEQRILHRTGGNFKRLQNKRDDEQAGDQHSRQRSQEFHRRLTRFFVHNLFFFFFWHVWYPFKRISSHSTSAPHLPRSLVAGCSRASLANDYPPTTIDFQRTRLKVRSQRVIWNT